MSFRGQPQNIDEVVAWTQEQLRAMQAPASSGRFVGPEGLEGPAGPADADAAVWGWATVAP